jgi:nucleotide-binding universal stress UspA family protein
MFRSILVPTDGLDVGNSVLPTARTLARLSGGEIILVHVLPAELSRGGSRRPEYKSNSHQDQLLDEEASQPGFPRTGITHHEDGAPANGTAPGRPVRVRRFARSSRAA